MLLPLVSPKSYAKLHTIPSLLSLSRRGVSLAGVDVPLPTLLEEARILRENPDGANAPEHAAESSGAFGWGYSAVTSMFGGVGSYFHLTEAKTASSPLPQLPPYWGQDIDHIVADAGGKVPRVLRDLAVAILNYCTDTEGIFRRSASSDLIPPLRALLDLPPSQQPRIDWTSVARADPLLPPILFKRLLLTLPAPVISSTLYPVIRKVHTPEDIRTVLLPALSPARAAVLSHAIHVAHHLVPYEQTTRMSSLALAIVLAPAMISGDPREDAAMCLQPGRSLPPGLLGDAIIDAEEGDNTLVGLLQTWISDYPAVAGEPVRRCQCRIASGASGAQTPVPGSPATTSPHRWSMLNPGGGKAAPPLESSGADN